jgi:hypothetical protein
VLVKWKTMQYELRTTRKKVYLPTGVSLDYTPKTSRGNGVGRNIQQQITSAKEMIEQGDMEAAYGLMMMYSYNNDNPPLLIVSQQSNNFGC